MLANDYLRLYRYWMLRRTAYHISLLAIAEAMAKERAATRCNG